ncbi:MAG: rod shape-determining protein [Clostridia bacterium]|nr:rod shape-determining protein [Clostridia bacterium]
MLGFFAKDIGIDLGTANTLVHLKGKGIIIREPSVVAIDKYTDNVVAVGTEAKEMLGRTPENLNAIRPLKDGVIANLTATRMMLKHLVDKACQRYMFARPRVVVCVPSGVTEVEERAVEEATLNAGAREVYLMEEPMAAAIGAGLRIGDPSGCMIVDIGGGTSEICVISLGGVVTSKSLRVAGDELNEAIMEYIRKKFNLAVGETTAEEIKISIGSAYPSMTTEEMDIKGRDLQTGLPRTITVTSIQIEEAMKEVVMQIVEAIKMTLEKTPPELAADIMVNGITLSGGGALIKNLDRLIAQETGIPVNVAETPLDCVVKGAGKVLDDLDNLKSVLINSRKHK